MLNAKQIASWQWPRRRMALCEMLHLFTACASRDALGHFRLRVNAGLTVVSEISGAFLAQAVGKSPTTDIWSRVPPRQWAITECCTIGAT